MHQKLTFFDIATVNYGIIGIRYVKNKLVYQNNMRI